jgi:hypothetical protein
MPPGPPAEGHPKNLSFPREKTSLTKVLDSMSTFLSMFVSLNQLRPPLKIQFQACQWVNWIFRVSLFWLANKKLLFRFSP